MIYKYKAVDVHGEIINSKIEGTSEEDCARKLKNMNLRPIQITIDLNKTKELNFYKKKFNYVELSLISLQLSTLIKSGANLPKSIEIIRKQEKNTYKKQIFNDIYTFLIQGESLYMSFFKCKNFPKLMTNMIKVGEESSNLEEVFLELSNYFQEEDKFHKKIQQALIYPCILLLVSVIVVNLLILNIIPTFEEIFNDAGVMLPNSTKFLISIFSFIYNKWIFIILSLSLISIFLYIFVKRRKGQLFKDRIKFKIPIIGEFNKKILNKRFSGTMAILIGSGMDLLSAITTTADTLNNTYVEELLIKSTMELTEGKSLNKALENSKIFPEMLVYLVETGEESSSLREIFKNIEEYYRYEMESSSRRIISLIEPILIIIMAFIVGFIIISLALPMFDMVNIV